MDHGFVGSGITQFLAGEPFDGLGVVAQGVEFSLQLLGYLPLLLQFRIQAVNPPPELLVLLNLRLVGHADKNQNRQDHEDDHRLREPAPDAEINFHLASLTPLAGKAKADFVSWCDQNWKGLCGQNWNNALGLLSSG